MNKYITLLVFIVVVMGGGITIGTLTAPAEWYAALQKPPFNPPSWVFGPVWTVLYLMIAFVGWRVWKRADEPILRPLWVLQMALNFSWSPIFFALQNPGLALVIIICLFLTIVLFIRHAWHPDRLSAMLFVPYAAWVGFATILNASIFYLNW